MLEDKWRGWVGWGVGDIFNLGVIWLFMSYVVPVGSLSRTPLVIGFYLRQCQSWKKYPVPVTMICPVIQKYKI